MTSPVDIDLVQAASVLMLDDEPSGSPGLTADQRLSLLEIVWDAVKEEIEGRHV